MKIDERLKSLMGDAFEAHFGQIQHMQDSNIGGRVGGGGERHGRRGEEAEGQVDYLGGLREERVQRDRLRDLNRKMAEVLHLVSCSELS